MSEKNKPQVLHRLDRIKNIMDEYEIKYCNMLPISSNIEAKEL